MKIFLVIIASLISTISVTGQESYLNTEGLEYLARGNANLINGNYENALEFFRESLSNAKQIDSEILHAESISGIYWCYLQLEEKFLADSLKSEYEQYILKSIDVGSFERSLSYKLSICGIYYVEAMVSTSDYRLAINKYKEVLESLTSKSDRNVISYVYEELSELNFLQNDLTSADYYNSKAIESAKECEDYLVLGEAYYNRGNYDVCLQSIDSCATIMYNSILNYKKLNVEYFLIAPYTLLSYSLLESRELSTAKEFIEELIRISKDYGLKATELLAYKFLAEYYYHSDKLEQCIQYYHLELVGRREINDVENIERCLLDLYQVQNEINNFDSLGYYGYELYKFYEEHDNIDEIIPELESILINLSNSNKINQFEFIINSLELNVPNIIDKNNRYDAFYILGTYYQLYKSPVDYDKAFYYYLQALPIVKGRTKEVEILLRLSYISTANQDKDQALIYLDRARELCANRRCRFKGEINLEYANIHSFQNDSLTIFYCEKALKFFKRSGDRHNEIKALIIFSRLVDDKYSNLRLKSSLELLKLAEISQNDIELETAYSNLASNYGKANNLGMEIKYLKKELEYAERNNSIEGIIGSTLSLLKADENGEHISMDEERLLFQKIESLSYEEIPSIYLSEIARLYSTKLNDNVTARKYHWYAIENYSYNSFGNPFDQYGLFLLNIGEDDSSKFYFIKALDIYTSSGNKEMAALKTLNIGKHFQDKIFDYKSAILFYKKGVEILNSLEQKIFWSNDKAVELYARWATCELLLGNLDSAIEITNNALKFDSKFRDNLYIILSGAYQLKGDVDSMYYYNSILLNSGAGEDIKLQAAFQRLEYDMINGDSLEIAKTINLIKKADLSGGIFSSNSPFRYAGIAIQKYYNDDPEYIKYFNLADSIALMNLNYNHLSVVRKYHAILLFYEKEYEQAFTILDSAISALDTHIKYLTDPTTIYNLISIRSRSDLQLFCAIGKKLYEETRDKKYLFKMFNLSEVMNSRATLKMVESSILEKRDIEYFSEELKRLTVKISKINSSLLNETNENVVETLLSKRNKLYTDYQHILNRYDHESIDENFINYSLKTVEEIQNNILKEDEVIIKYFIYDTFGFAIAVNKKEIFYFAIPDPKIIDLNVKVIRNFYQNYIPDQNKEVTILKKYGHPLFEDLISPIHNEIKEKKLIIIPDRSLYYLPFEILVVDTLISPIENHNYLLNDVTISYIPSISLYGWLNDREISNSKSVLLIGKEIFSSIDLSDELRSVTYNFQLIGDLPGVKQEIESIENILKLDYNVITLLGDSATEGNIKNSELAIYKYIHLATHGIIDDTNPEFSTLLLDEYSHPNSIDDGLLQSYEIAKLEISTDLVVLSACNTALGKIYTGEGMVGLSQSFFIAGTKSLCLTLWSISDASTGEFMSYFYKNLSEGLPKTIALQKAKLSMMNSEKYSSPYYWAPYILSGATN